MYVDSFIIDGFNDTKTLNNVEGGLATSVINSWPHKLLHLFEYL